MNVILRAARDQSFESVLAGDAAEEGPEIILDFRRDEVASVFR
jgi:hypothetical protein